MAASARLAISQTSGHHPAQHTRRINHFNQDFLLTTKNNCEVQLHNNSIFSTYSIVCTFFQQSLSFLIPMAISIGGFYDEPFAIIYYIFDFLWISIFGKLSWVLLRLHLFD